MRGKRHEDVIYKSQLLGMKLRAKPKCPLCNNPLTFIYDDVQKGHINEKCDKCKNRFLIDLQTLQIYQILDDPKI